MTSCCFEEDFFKKSAAEFDRMVQEMKGAVAAARCGTDEAIRQVGFFDSVDKVCVLCLEFESKF